MLGWECALCSSGRWYQSSDDEYVACLDCGWVDQATSLDILQVEDEQDNRCPLKWGDRYRWHTLLRPRPPRWHQVPGAYSVESDDDRESKFPPSAPQPPAGFVARFSIDCAVKRVTEAFWMEILKTAKTMRRDVRAAIRAQYYSQFMTQTQLTRLFNLKAPAPKFIRYQEGCGHNGLRTDYALAPWGFKAMRNTIRLELQAAESCPPGLRGFGLKKRHAAAWKFGAWLTDAEISALLHRGLPPRKPRAQGAAAKPAKAKPSPELFLQRQQQLLGKRKPADSCRFAKRVALKKTR